MPADAFEVEAFDETGNRYRVKVSAQSQEEAVRTVALRGFSDVRVVGRAGRERRAAKGVELAQVCRELASILEADVPLPEALAELAREAGRGRIARALREASADVERGVGLEEALGRRVKAFGWVLVQLVRAGQASGDLPGALRRHAGDLEENAELSRDVRQALFYPLAVLGLLLATVIIGIAVLVPRLYGALAYSLGSKALADEALASLRPILWVLAAVGAVFCGGCGVWTALSVRRAGGRRGGLGRRILESLPVAGGMMRAASRARFFSSFASLVSGEAPMGLALELAGEASGWEALAEAAARTAEGVRGGKALSEAMLENDCGGPAAAWMVKAAEGHGELVETLRELARLARSDARRSALKIRVLVTPVCVVIAGCAIAAVAYGFFLALYSAFDLAAR